MRLFPPLPDSDPVTHSLDSMSDLFEYALRNCNESDMVVVTISNEVNVQDKPIGISFRRKDQLSEEVIWSVFQKCRPVKHQIQCHERIGRRHSFGQNACGFWSTALRSKGRELANMAHLKRSIIKVKAENN